MELTKDFYKFSLYSVLWFIPLALIVNGTMQKYIYFPDALNEAGTAFFALMGFILTFGIAVSEFIKSVKGSNE